MKTRHPLMTSISAQSTNELQWFDFMKIGHRDSCPRTGSQRDIPICPIITGCYHIPPPFLACFQYLGCWGRQGDEQGAVCHLEQPHLENKSTASWATLWSWQWKAWVMILSQCKQHNSWDHSTINDLEKLWIIASSHTLNAVNLCKIFCINYLWCPGSLSREREI